VIYICTPENMKKVFFVLLSILVLSSCSTRKEIVYFQGAENLEGMESLMEFEPVFEVNDLLQIQVSSINPEVVIPFQMNMMGGSNQMGGAGAGNSGGSTGGGGRNQGAIGYLIDVDGNIQFPVLGKIPAAGMSRSEFEAFLTEELKTYVKDAVVAVRLLNFRIVVLGETGQSVVPVANERISVPELIASAGGITYDGKRDNILIIREIDGVKTVGRVDMTSADVFKNPFYYLKQNDIVYVEPTYRQVKSAGFITSYQGLVSVATTVFSLIILLTR